MSDREYGLRNVELTTLLSNRAGERQLIALARAIVKDSRVLALDE